MDLPFWGFHPFRPLRAYPNWVVNKHHVISHSHDLLQPCNKDLDRADSIVLSCYNTNLYSYLPQVVNPQRLSFPQIHLFFFWIPFQSSSSCLRSSSCLDLKAQPEKPTSACTLSAYLSLFAAPAHTFPAYIFCYTSLHPVKLFFFMLFHK